MFTWCPLIRYHLRHRSGSLLSYQNFSRHKTESENICHDLFFTSFHEKKKQNKAHDEKGNKDEEDRAVSKNIWNNFSSFWATQSRASRRIYHGDACETSSKQRVLSLKLDDKRFLWVHWEKLKSLISVIITASLFIYLYIAWLAAKIRGPIPKEFFIDRRYL